MKCTFKTVAQISEHLQAVKKRMDKIIAKNPDLSFSTYGISEIPLDLMYAIDEEISKSDKYRPSVCKLEFKNEHLSVWAWWKPFAITCYFTSVKCIEDDECIRKRKFKEFIEIAPPDTQQLLETA